VPCVHQDEALGGDRVLSDHWQFYRSHSLPQFVSAARNLITCRQSVNMFTKKIFARFTPKRLARTRVEHDANSRARGRIARCITKASNSAACMRDACFDDAILRRSRARVRRRGRRNRRGNFFSSGRVRNALLRVAQAKLRGLATTRTLDRMCSKRNFTIRSGDARPIFQATAAEIAAANRSRSAADLVSVAHTSSTSPSSQPPSCAYSSPSA